jgi:hypothetical protein
MSKPYTDAEFSEQITADRTWRLKEISDLKSATIKADENSRRVLLRSLITICYAHWEGYVRFAALRYLEYVARRKIQFKDLERQFLRNYFLPRLAALSLSKTSVKQRCELVDEILNSSERRFSRVHEDLVNTEANLNFDVFADICLICGVPISNFDDKATFIDVFLLKRRNAVAHGEETTVEIEDMDQLGDETVAIMRAFGDALENNVCLKTYRCT